MFQDSKKKSCFKIELTWVCSASCAIRNTTQACKPFKLRWNKSECLCLIMEGWVGVRSLQTNTPPPSFNRIVRLWLMVWWNNSVFFCLYLYMRVQIPPNTIGLEGPSIWLWTFETGDGIILYLCLFIQACVSPNTDRTSPQIWFEYVFWIIRKSNDTLQQRLIC